MEKTNEEILLEYEKNKFNNEKKRDYFIEKLNNMIPELKEIQKEMNKLTMANLIENVSSSISKEEKEKKAKVLKEKINNLEKRKEEILNSYKISKENLEVKYDCNKCQDTGFLQNNGKTEKCSCFIQKQMEQKYRMSNLNTLNKKTFENFSLEFYEEENEKGENPKEKAEKVIKILNEFINDFDRIKNSDKNSIILCGQTGVGKTHLIQAVGHELIEKNYTVLFDTSSNIFNKLMEYRFNYKMDKYNELVNYLNDVDLLILDDLGTESLNEPKKEEMFLLFNSRLSQNKPILASSNYDIQGLKARYDDRIASRIVERCRFIGVLGKDYRVEKSRSAIKKVEQ